MILAVIIVLGLIFTPNSAWMTTITKNNVSQASSSLDPHVFQGLLMQRKMLEDKHYLPIYGSSELLRLDKYHPTNYFKVNPDGFTPFLVGRGGMYSLVHFLNLAAMGGELHNRKVVMILSPQWFTQKGLDKLHFSPNFSKEQAYDFVFNKELDPKLKQRAAKRFLQFKFIRDDGKLAGLLRDIAYPKQVSKIKWLADDLEGHFTYKILTLHDILEAHHIRPGYHKGQRQKPDPALKNLSWAGLRAAADKTGKSQTRSNPYGISDSYFDKKIAPKMGHLRGYRSKEQYRSSPEYGDLQLVLDLLKEDHAKVLFISVPFNGRWYDFAGVPKERRQIYYRKVTKQIRQNGFQVADFSGHEYDKYFLKDTMHLGWKGWVDIDKAIKTFYNEK
ncbi:D-alanyl-lipoteichoic acid biosynthesis protein DltD [Terrilactibacillus sp. S3-3]|nr:D-alanyl-lipoteichoic acid biosynthesis protein DltD [Terrilactibacillus sp. S3-3]